jgi:formiminoglutamase
MADVGNIRRLESVEDTLDRAELVMTWLLRTVPGRLLVLGGGHDIAYAHFSALIENTPDTRRTGIINIDAHFDVRPVKDKITSGTPFWRLLEKNDERFRGHELVEFGIQSHMAAPAHRRYLEQRGATIHMLRDSGPEGHLRVFKVAVDALAKRAHTIGVSFDMDAVRMSDAKGASAPSATGLSALDAIRISEAVGADRRIRTYGIYETSPPLDDGSAVRLAAQMCFHYALGIAKPER